jgi:hypothetical protein
MVLLFISFSHMKKENGQNHAAAHSTLSVEEVKKWLEQKPKNPDIEAKLSSDWHLHVWNAISKRKAAFGVDFVYQ